MSEIDRTTRRGPERETIWDAAIALPPSTEDEIAAAEEDEAVASTVSLDFLVPTDDPQSLGRLGAYEVVGIVGRGGTGIVLKAFDRTLNRFVAMMLQHRFEGLVQGAEELGWGTSAIRSDLHSPNSLNRFGGQGTELQPPAVSIQPR